MTLLYSVLGAVLLALIAAIAIELAIQEREDRILAEEIARTASELQVVGANIANIRDVDLKSMNDYVSAYVRIEPLLNEYDQQLQRYAGLYSQARQRDRRLIDVQRFYGRPHLTNWQNMSEILGLTRQLSEIIRSETSAIHNMASLPEPERVRFFHERFLPLEAQETALRERLLVVGKRMSPSEIQ
jgi:hypothetical protein